MANGEPLSRPTRHAMINPDLTLPVRVLSVTQISDCNPTSGKVGLRPIS